MSIVLVIIGLIVGGMLVGRDLIVASAVRAQLTQIEKYNQAVNAFAGKYSYLPGDIPAIPAAQFGFSARGTLAGQGDGNGIIEGTTGSPASWGTKNGSGETSVFWRDLSYAKLIDGYFILAYSSTYPAYDITGTVINNYMPPAKIGNGNYVYVWSGGWYSNGPATSNGINYFGISAVTSIGVGNPLPQGRVYSTPGLTVSQAYNMDKKVDDGSPQSGNVLALYLNGNIADGVYWAAGGGGQGASNSNAPTTQAKSSSTQTCYDNGRLGGMQQYSVTTNNGTGVNCALSFRMQAGD